MKILFITPLFPTSLDEDRTKKTFALLDFVQRWKQKHEVQVIRPQRVKPYSISQMKAASRLYDIDGLQVLHVPVPDVQRLNLHFTLPGTRKSASFLEQIGFQPDIVVSHYHVGHLIAFNLARKYSLPHVLGIHKRDVENLGRNEKRFFRVFRNACLLAFRSHSLQRRYHRLVPDTGSSREFIASSGIGDHFYSLIPASREKSTPQEVVRIVTVSSLKARKKIDLVLRALSKIKDTKWTFTIIGDGEDRAALELLSKQLGIADKVEFRGYLSHEQVAEELSSYDLFVLVSVRETFGLAYLEAMAAGCLVIGAKEWGIDGVIQDGENGFLCQPESEQELVVKLQLAMGLSSSEWKKMRTRSLNTVQEYSIEHRAALYLEQIERVAEEWNRTKK